MGYGFLAHLVSLMVKMSQKSSRPQPAKFVSEALTPDRRLKGQIAAALYMQILRGSKLRPRLCSRVQTAPAGTLGFDGKAQPMAILTPTLRPTM